MQSFCPKRIFLKFEKYLCYNIFLVEWMIVTSPRTFFHYNLSAFSIPHNILLKDSVPVIKPYKLINRTLHVRWSADYPCVKWIVNMDTDLEH